MKIYISPLAGITDYAYRKIIEKFSPDLLFTEMVNARLLSENDSTTENELLKCDSKSITGVQVFGNHKPDIISSFLKLEEMGFDRINLNMGCPQPKIVKNGAGAALLPETEFIRELLYELKARLQNRTKISIKIRIGYKDFSRPEIYLKLADSLRLDFICVHGRNQEQMYSGAADWKIIKELSSLKRNIDFIGNGDLIYAESIPDIISGSSIDGIMLARGIIGNPWLIPQVKEILSTGKISTFPSFREIRNTLMEHLYLLSESKGEFTASMEINKFIKPYFKNFHMDDIDRILSEIIMEKNFKSKMKSISQL